MNYDSLGLPVGRNVKLFQQDQECDGLTSE